MTLGHVRLSSIYQAAQRGRASRERWDPEKRNKRSNVARGIAIELYLAFHEEVGHTVCAEIHKLKFGRTYRLYDPEEQKAFHEAGGHSDEGCPLVCATAARITADIILRLRAKASGTTDLGRDDLAVGGVNEQGRTFSVGQMREVEIAIE